MLTSKCKICEGTCKLENTSPVDTMIEHAHMYLKAGEWKLAVETANWALEKEHRNVQAFLVKLLADYKCKKIEDLGDLKESFKDNINYAKVISFADDELKNELDGCLEKIKNVKSQKVSKKKKRVTITLVTIVASVLVVFLIFKVASPIVEYFQKIKTYNQATYLYNADEYLKALSLFESLGDYRDSKQMHIESLKKIREQLPNGVISVSRHHAAGVRADGTVVVSGVDISGESNVDDWTDIVAVLTGSTGNIKGITGGYTIGLKSNGTVVYAGFDAAWRDEIGNWKDIAAITDGYGGIIGLKKDGTVVCCGDDDIKYELAEWNNIVEVSAGNSHIVGVKSDGAVVTICDHDKCCIKNWTDIVSVSTDYERTFGLKSNGEIVIADEDYEYDFISDLKNIVAISGAYALTAEGTVVCIDRSYDDYGNMNHKKMSWTNIVAIQCGTTLVGLQENGVVVSDGILEFRRLKNGKYVKEKYEIILNNVKTNN